MKAETLDFNAITLLRAELESTLRSRIVEDIMANMVSELEEKIRPIIVEEAKKVGIKSLEQFRDMIGMRDELKLLVKVEE